MIKVNEAVIVEGKYDKIKLSSIIDGLIIETGGFRIFKDKNKMNLIRNLAQTRGILIITDSDGAGFVIRNHLKSCIPVDKIKNAYIPDIYGKEKRKEKPSKEGKLGVEGMSESVIIDALEKCGVVCDTVTNKSENKKITKSDFFVLGLTGGSNSEKRRNTLKKALSIPEYMTTNAMIDTINFLMTRAEFLDYINNLFCEENTFNF